MDPHHLQNKPLGYLQQVACSLLGCMGCVAPRSGAFCCMTWLVTVLYYHVLPSAERVRRGYTGRMTECEIHKAQLAWRSQTPPMCGNYFYQSLKVASGCCEGCILPPSLADGRQTRLGGN
jgi:hypothetical protein